MRKSATAAAEAEADHGALSSKIPVDPIALLDI